MIRTPAQSSTASLNRMKKYTIKTLEQLEESFWENHPELPKPRNSVAIRTTPLNWELWVQFVDNMCRDSQISDMLAWKAAPEPGKKTPPAFRANARNYHRRKNGVPAEAPLHTRSDPFNRTRRGTGNVTRYIAMSPDDWDELDKHKGRLSRGEYVQQIMHKLSSMKNDMENAKWENDL